MQIFVFLWEFVFIYFRARELCHQHFQAMPSLPRSHQGVQKTPQVLQRRGWKYFRNVFIVPCPSGREGGLLNTLFILLLSPWGVACIYIPLLPSLHGYIFWILWTIILKKKNYEDISNIQANFSHRKLFLMRVQGCYILISTWNKFILKWQFWGLITANYFVFFLP